MNNRSSIILTGIQDASTAISLGNGLAWVAEDENDSLRLFDLHTGGAPLKSYDAKDWYGEGKETDIEASCLGTRNPQRIFWLGSMSNSRKGKERKDRDRLFATDMIQKGNAHGLSYVGSAQGLRPQLIAWGLRQGYPMDHYAMEGIEPKRPDAFNIEGLETSPDGKDLYIAFRSPLVGAKNNRALIAPLSDFEELFQDGKPHGKPTFAPAIELDLGGRGIRSLGKNSHNQYLIVAGATDATADFALFVWDGKRNGKPRRVLADLDGLAPEAIVAVPEDLSKDFRVQLISDFGAEKPAQADWITVRAE